MACANRCLVVIFVATWIGLAKSEASGDQSLSGPNGLQSQDAVIDRTVVNPEQINCLRVGMSLGELHKALRRALFIMTGAGPYYRAAGGGLYGVYVDNDYRVTAIVYCNRGGVTYLLPTHLRGKKYDGP